MNDWAAIRGGTDGSVASLFDVYDDLLVPLVFRSYAEDLVARLADVRTGSVLELAAGTGAVTRPLAAALPAEVAITATDLVPGMIERAERIGTARPVTWEQADAMALPYADESFDVVVCQFGAMFLTPKAAAFAEARRVLRPGGRFLFNVWDRLDANEVPAAVCDVVKGLFADDPPGFLERTPYGYHDPEVIAADLRAGGFDGPSLIEAVEHVNAPMGPVEVATAICAGTPMRDEIEGQAPGRLGDVIAAVAVALADRYGPGDVAGPTRAMLASVVR